MICCTLSHIAVHLPCTTVQCSVTIPYTFPILLPIFPSKTLCKRTSRLRADTCWALNSLCWSGNRVTRKYFTLSTLSHSSLCVCRGHIAVITLEANRRFTPNYLVAWRNYLVEKRCEENQWWLQRDGPSFTRNQCTSLRSTGIASLLQEEQIKYTSIFSRQSDFRITNVLSFICLFQAKTKKFSKQLPP